MRLFIYVSLCCLSAVVMSLFLATLKVKAEIPTSFIDTPIYKFVKEWEGKRFGNCKEWANFLTEKFPDIECYRFNTKVGGHWACVVDKELGIETDSNWDLRGTVRMFIVTK